MKTITTYILQNYLAFGLEGIVNGNRVKLDALNQNSLETQPSIRGFRYCGFDKFKPLLHPLSSLTKTITHEDKEIVPIYEMMSTQGFSMDKPENYEYSFSTDFGCNTAMMRNGDWIFRYMGKEKSFWVNGLGVHEKHQKTYKSLDLFQMLFKWHFDVFGLIENGLAIPKDPK